MTPHTLNRGGALLSLRRQRPEPTGKSKTAGAKSGGFGAKAGGGKKASKARRKASGLTAADRLPLGKAPDCEAMKARGFLHLPLSGRLSPQEVKVAYKTLAAQHHPDQGGDMATMQGINLARDVLLEGYR